MFRHFTSAPLPAPITLPHGGAHLEAVSGERGSPRSPTAVADGLVGTNHSCVRRKVVEAMRTAKASTVGRTYKKIDSNDVEARLHCCQDVGNVDER